MKTIATALSVLGISLIATGSFAQAPSTTTTTTTVITPAPAPSKEVGVSSRDGITISGADVLITRNGTTEKLTKELELPNGLRVQPNGTILTREGGSMTIRPTQVLNFDGRFLDAPIVESVAPKTTAPVTQTVVVEKPVMTQQAMDEAARMEAARVEAERRANAINKGPIRAGEGVQK